MKLLISFIILSLSVFSNCKGQKKTFIIGNESYFDSIRKKENKIILCYTAKDCYKCNQVFIPIFHRMNTLQIPDSNILIITDHFQNTREILKATNQSYAIMPNKQLVSIFTYDGKSKIIFKKENLLTIYEMLPKYIDTIFEKEFKTTKYTWLNKPIYDSVLSSNQYSIVPTNFGISIFDKLSQKYIYLENEIAEYKLPILGDTNLYYKLPYRVKPNFQLINNNVNNEVLTQTNLSDIHIESINKIGNKLYTCFSLHRAFLNTFDTSEVSVFTSYILNIKSLDNNEQYKNINIFSSNEKYIYLDTINFSNETYAPSTYFANTKYSTNDALYLLLRKVDANKLDYTKTYLAKIDNETNPKISNVKEINNPNEAILNDIYGSYLDSVDYVYINNILITSVSDNRLWITRKQIPSLGTNQLVYKKLENLKSFFVYEDKIYTIEKIPIDNDYDFGKIILKQFKVSEFEDR